MSVDNSIKFALYLSAKSAGERVKFEEKETTRLNVTDLRQKTRTTFMSFFTFDNNDYRIHIQYINATSGRWPGIIKISNLTQRRAIVTQKEIEELHEMIATGVTSAKIIKIKEASKIPPVKKREGRMTLQEILGDDYHTLSKTGRREAI